MYKLAILAFLLSNFACAKNDPISAYEHIIRTYPTILKEIKDSGIKDDEKAVETFFSNTDDYIRKTYHPLLKKLKKGERCTTNEIRTAFEKDQLLTYDPKGGHNKFDCELLNIYFCISGHKSSKIEDGERVGLIRDIQIYINTVKLLYKQTKDLVKVLKTKMRKSDFTSLHKAEEARYEEYSKE